MAEESIVDDLVDEWETANEQGRVLSIEELCHQHPQLIDRVAEQIEALMRIDQRFLNRSGSDSSGKGNDLLSTSQLCNLVFHAKGGLGAVYKGTEKALNRSVAVKFIHHRMVGDTECRNRFLLEAEVTGRLEHPGIVPVYGIGEAENGASSIT